ncbi:hypothetical protein ABEB36_015522 [Hypothenemus hampei]|uniref:DUF7083 domain-containing protein n=1 Tax=Hypothenemus hampei TaxID=57062 RepID=A0ABD1DZN8_HYPHA
MAHQEEIGKTLIEFTKSQQDLARKQQADLLKSQQDFLMQFATQVGKNSSNGNEIRMESLASAITEFNYNEHSGHTFNAWFRRHEGIFEENAMLRKLPAVNFRTSNKRKTKQPRQSYSPQELNIGPIEPDRAGKAY